MGSVVSGVLGGGKSGSSSTSGKTGFASLPIEIQKAFTQYGTQVGDLFKGSQADAFKPMPQTADETAALEAIRGGLAPTQDSIARDLQMFMNPYDDYVINDINRQAQGKNSLVNQAATQAGQQGSNRSFLASSDVEQNRLNNIGQFRQNQYNTALDNVLGPLARLRQQDIANLFNAGGFQRGLDTQTRQAPFNALSQYGQLLGALPQGTTNPNVSQSSMQGGSLGGALGNVGSIMGAVGSFFSDKNLKENIVKVGVENGFPIYEFNYKGNDHRFRGVMAQDVMDIMPEAVDEVDGYMTVNYDMIGLKMEDAHG